MNRDQAERKSDALRMEQLEAQLQETHRIIAGLQNRIRAMQHYAYMAGHTTGDLPCRWCGGSECRWPRP